MTPLRAGPIGLLFACLALLGAVLLWPARSPRRVAVMATCLSNVKQSSLGLIMYGSDHDDRFPQRDEWMDATLPYTKNEMIWHCLSVKKGDYGYAFNGALSQFDSKRLTAPDRMPLIYESVNPIRNASDLVASLPLKPRHSKANARNAVAYADGHAKGLPGGVLP